MRSRKGLPLAVLLISIIGCGPTRSQPSVPEDSSPPSNASLVRAVQLTFPPSDAADIEARWSADGRQVYFTRVPFEGYTTTIRRVDPVSGKTARVAEGESPAPSPDGRWLVYVKDRTVTLRDLEAGKDRIVAEWGAWPIWEGSKRFSYYGDHRVK